MIVMEAGEGDVLVVKTSGHLETGELAAVVDRIERGQFPRLQMTARLHDQHVALSRFHRDHDSPPFPQACARSAPGSLGNCPEPRQPPPAARPDLRIIPYHPRHRR